MITLKREELKNLGLTDEQLEGVMKIHGHDTEAMKAKFSDYDEIKAKNDDLTSRIKKNDADLKKLSKSSKDNEELRNQISELQEENKKAKTDFDSKVQGMKLDNAINNVLSEHKARNGKSVKALLDMDNIKFDDKGELTGLSDQLETVEKENPFLFDKGETQHKQTGGNEGGGVSDKQILKNVWSNGTNH